MPGFVIHYQHTIAIWELIHFGQDSLFQPLQEAFGIGMAFIYQQIEYAFYRQRRQHMPPSSTNEGTLNGSLLTPGCPVGSTGAVSLIQTRFVADYHHLRGVFA